MLIFDVNAVIPVVRTIKRFQLADWHTDAAVIRLENIIARVIKRNWTFPFFLINYYYFFHWNKILFFRKTKIEVETPEVECEDGSKISPLKVTFLESQGQWFIVFPLSI